MVDSPNAYYISIIPLFIEFLCWDLNTIRNMRSSLMSSNRIILLLSKIKWDLLSLFLFRYLIKGDRGIHLDLRSPVEVG